MATRTQLLVRGLVQGVGFRPYVFGLARRRALRGQVFNNTSGVLIDLEGDGFEIENFIRDLSTNPPPLAFIESVERQDSLARAHYIDFRIVASTAEGVQFVPISPDIATCRDCLDELFDPRDRRHRYPFINCTNCGPRFTIVEGIPYDRAQTTMRDFEMCRECRAEYENPLDRRFHAEPTACPECGPRVKLTDAEGNDVEAALIDRADAITLGRRLLLEGKILVIKGIGGFHLACDALNAEAVNRLRQRKYREDKPFALMANSLALVSQYCSVSRQEENLLVSASRPVVLLEKRPYVNIPDAVAPKVTTLGFMLPYTPLHHLLMEDLDRPLVMTSGNVSDEPICYEDEEAIRRLNNIADNFLFHDRKIHIRTDDSVARVAGGRDMLVRRSRGYAPAPIRTALRFASEILGCGAELKNTFCLARDRSVFVSHHIGDLENLETLRSFTEGIEHYKRLFHLRPEIVAHDLHPEYLSTKYANSLEDKVRIGVQHHHAHIASCMADNMIDGDVIGVAMDGLGFGSDGAMWGGEFFVADFLDAERIAHLEYVPMAGGAKAIREPWRMAAVYLDKTFGDEFLELQLPFVRDLDVRAWTAIKKMVATGTNSPQTSSIGRLFDAISSLVGLRRTVNYEGQAAIELEAIARHDSVEAYEFDIETNGVIKADKVIRGTIEDLLGGLSPGVVSAKFHYAVAELIAAMARQIGTQSRLTRIVLSGGVFQNTFLLDRVRQLLAADHFEVFTHRRVPTNDAGISLGQVVVGNAHLAAGRI